MSGRPAASGAGAFSRNLFRGAAGSRNSKLFSATKKIRRSFGLGFKFHRKFRLGRTTKKLIVLAPTNRGTRINYRQVLRDSPYP